LSEWRKLTKIAILPLMPLCIVSFVDLDGLRHAVEVQADGLYEAAVLGLAAFKKHDCQPGAITQLDVEVRSSIVHSVPVHKVTKWLARGVNSPKEAILKERLRSLL
jgi:hypothetical protein